MSTVEVKSDNCHHHLGLPGHDACNQPLQMPQQPHVFGYSLYYTWVIFLLLVQGVANTRGKELVVALTQTTSVIAV